MTCLRLVEAPLRTGPRTGPRPGTSTPSNFYTGLKFGSKKHFYGRVAPEGILALHMEIDLFTAAERPERVLVSKCTFTAGLFPAHKNLVLYLYTDQDQEMMTQPVFTVLHVRCSTLWAAQIGSLGKPVPPPLFSAGGRLTLNA